MTKSLVSITCRFIWSKKPYALWSNNILFKCSLFTTIFPTYLGIKWQSPCGYTDLFYSACDKSAIIFKRNGVNWSWCSIGPPSTGFISSRASTANKDEVLSKQENKPTNYRPSKISIRISLPDNLFDKSITFLLPEINLLGFYSIFYI